MIDDKATAEYAENMAHFIRDVAEGSRSLPNLPVVIGQMGVDGMNAQREYREVQRGPGRRRRRCLNSRAMWRW